MLLQELASRFNAVPAAIELPAARDETMLMGVCEVKVVFASRVIPFTLLPAAATVPAAKTLPGSILLPAASVVPAPRTVLPAKTDPGASFEPAVTTVLPVMVTALERFTPFFATEVPFKMLPAAIKLPAASSLLGTIVIECSIKVVPFKNVAPTKVVFPATTTVPPKHCA